MALIPHGVAQYGGGSPATRDTYSTGPNRGSESPSQILTFIDFFAIPARSFAVHLIEAGRWILHIAL